MAVVVEEGEVGVVVVVVGVMRMVWQERCSLRQQWVWLSRRG